MPEWVTVGPWVWTLAVIAGAVVVSWFVKSVVLKRLERMAAATDNDLDDRLVHFFRSFFTVVLIFAAFVAILKVHGIQITALLAGAGIAGIAIGLAAKETLADVLAGIFLITDRPMRVGDRVKIERIGSEWGGWGDVVDIGLRRTRVRNTDGVIVDYPNNVLANSVITNFSAEPGPVRVRVRFAVAADADLAKTRDVSRLAIERTEGVLEGTPDVVIRSVWDMTYGHLHQGVLMEGRYRIEDVRHRTRIRSRVLENLVNDLQESGIPLAAPKPAR